MSTGERFPLEYARRVVDRLREAVGCNIGDVVGSVRRCSPQVGDLEFIAPMPHEGDLDRLYTTLAAHFYDPKVELVRPAVVATQTVLFAPPPLRGPESIRLERRELLGTPERGLKPGFRAASLVLNLQHPKPAAMKIQVFRYDDGPQGNRGWIEMIRTGTSEFSAAFMARWQQIRAAEWGRPMTEQGCSDGYPLFANGSRIPVPDEHTGFKLLRMNYIEPPYRLVDRVQRYRK